MSWDVYIPLSLMMFFEYAGSSRSYCCSGTLRA